MKRPLPLAILLLSAGLALSQETPPAGSPPADPAVPPSAAGGLTIDHDAVGCLVAGQFPRLEACIDPRESVARARVYFRAAGSENWYYVDMIADVSRKRPETLCYAGVLPRPSKGIPKVEYYVEALDRSFTQVRTEEYDPDVVSDVKGCKRPLPPAPVVKSATVAVGTASSAASIVPAGFTAAGVVGATTAAVTTTAAVVGAGAAAVSTVAVTQATSEETTTTTAAATTTTAPPPSTEVPSTTTTTTLPPLGTNAPPYLDLTVTPNPAAGYAPLTVTFNLCGSRDPDGDPLGYWVDFGDGEVDRSSCRVDHVYTGASGLSRASRGPRARAAEITAVACVTDNIPGHDQCRRVLVIVEQPPIVVPSPSPSPGPNCAADRTPPVASLMAPASNEVITASSYLLQAWASDSGVGVASVRFAADQLDGPARFSASDSALPYEVVWPVPSACGGRFAVSVDATDLCGNFVSAAPHFVVVNNSCPPVTKASGRAFTWISRLDVEGGWAQLVLDGRSATFPREGPSVGEGEAQPGENRLEGQLVRSAGRPGTWRLELGPRVVPGSLRVIAGQPSMVGADAVEFRLSGIPGERVVVGFRVRD